MAKGTRSNGDFCWMNMLTPQPAAACRFFGELLGWTYGEIPGMGFSVKVGGRDIGGMFDLNGPNTPPGTPAVIGVMIKVASADAIGARVAELGGRALPAFDIMDQGRMAVCFDPAGANFDVWEPRKGQGSDADSTLHGAPSWFEASSSDVKRDSRFYCDLFGWTSQSMAMPSGDYAVLHNQGTPMAGMMPVAAGAPQWATYFTVTDADAAAALAVKLSGTVETPLHDVPGVGRTCGIRSPQGVPFQVIAYAS